MSPDKLVHMANQIAAFMESRRHDEAVAGIAEHINDYWEPRMRVQFLDMLAAGRSDLRPLVLEAAPLIRRPDASAA
jgi:formate dehydrogenase subunit delta